MTDLTPQEFSIALTAWCEATKSDIDRVCRETVFKTFSGLIGMSPVGNPELWAANSLRVNHNKFVDSYNTMLRTDPRNLNARGYLRPVLKARRQRMRAGRGYVGGRFISAWTVSCSPNVMPPPLNQVDPGGKETIERGKIVLRSFKAGGVIWIVDPLPYATRLEFGHSRQAPAGLVRVTLANAQYMFETAIKNIQAGMPEDPK